MIKPTVVLAELDEDYITALEEKFIEELGEKVELEVITEEEYFKEYFQQSKKIDVLVVEEQLYSRDLEDKNIDNIFVLQGNITQTEQKGSVVKRILRYSTPDKIYKQIVASNKQLLKLCDEKQLSKTKTIVVYSPIGGVGKTTLSLGISACIGKEHKVLYINAERMNSFQYFFENTTTIPNHIGMKLDDDISTIYSIVKEQIEEAEVDYLLPFEVALSSIGLKYSIYNKIIEAVKQADEYDYIIVDTDVVFDSEKATMMTKADTVLVVGNQKEKTKHVMEVLKKNVVYDALEMYYICNCYEETKKNYVCIDDFRVYENVHKIEDMGKLNLKLLAEEKDIQKISLLVM